MCVCVCVCVCVFVCVCGTRYCCIARRRHLGIVGYVVMHVLYSMLDCTTDVQRIDAGTKLMVKRKREQ